MPFMRAPNCATGPHWDEELPIVPSPPGASNSRKISDYNQRMHALPIDPVDPLQAVQQVRRFNRTVTEGVGALDDHFLGRALPLGEARLLWEIGSDGIEIRALRGRLGLDS